MSGTVRTVYRLLSMSGAMIMAFTILDSIAVLLTGTSLAMNLFGSGSPVSEALIEVIPGMTPLEFITVNIVSIVIIAVIMVICIYYAFPKACECPKEGRYR